VIPGALPSFPRQEVRVCVGERTPYEKDGRTGWTTRRLDHLFLAKLAKRRAIGGAQSRGPKTDAGEPMYRKDPRLMEALREEHLKAECQEHCCRQFRGDIADWEPLWVPIYVIGPPAWYWQEEIGRAHV
jgi:hypothetical protein